MGWPVGHELQYWQMLGDTHWQQPKYKWWASLRSVAPLLCPPLPRATFFNEWDQTWHDRRSKDVGVCSMLTPMLHPNNHCKKAEDKAHIVFKQITKNFHKRVKLTFLKHYKQFVRTHPEVASPVWSPWQARDIDELEKVQKNYLKMTIGLNGTTVYEEEARRQGWAH